MPVIQNIDHVDFGNLLQYRLKDMGMNYFTASIIRKTILFRTNSIRLKKGFLLDYKTKIASKIMLPNFFYVLPFLLLNM